MGRLHLSLRRCCCLVLALFALFDGRTTSATTSVRVAIPDLAGMLYPQQAQGRVMLFASPSLSLQPFSARRITGNEFVSRCDAVAAVCLDVAWASQYQHDPFVLVAFESKYAIHSATFDGETNTDILLPVIEGNQNSASAATSMRTLWRFHAVASASANATIDVLFRLRQQSQLRAVRDQLLVHVVASQLDDRTSQAAVETYSVYGNQRVLHTIVRSGGRQVRLDVDITRNPNRSDVMLVDAYPLAPLVPATASSNPRLRIVDDTCRRCWAQFLGCDAVDDLDSGACSFEKSTAELPTCLRTRRGLTSDWFHGVLSGALGEEHPLTGVLWSCLSEIYTREGSPPDGLPGKQSHAWSSTSTLSCLSVRQCPFGPADDARTKMLQFSTPVSSSYRIEWPTLETLSGAFTMVIGGGPEGYPAFSVTSDTVITDQSPAADVASVLQSILSGLEFVRVHVTKRLFDSSAHFDIEISGLPVYCWINFVPDPVTSVSITPIEPDGGMTYLRITPFNSSGVVFETDCDWCVSELSVCRKDDACRLQVLPCIAQTFARVDVSTASVNAEFGTYRVELLPAFAAQCFANVSVASWNPIRRSLVCLSRYKCRLDAAMTTSIDEQTFFRLENGSQVLAVPIETGPAGEALVDLLITTPQATLRFHSAVDKLATFMRTFVMGNAADVTVDVQAYAANASWIQLYLTYANTVLPWMPAFTGPSEVVVTENLAPMGSLEFADATAFSLDKISAAIQPFLNLPPAINEDPASVAASGNDSWHLAPECLACSGLLYGCSSEQVARKVCRYGNASSPLAQCIRQALPREALVALLNTSADILVPPRVVTTDVTRCIQTAAALAGDTLASRVAATTALGCFAESKCPFGPLDLVDANRTLQLTASALVQSLRIPARHFALDLILSMGAHTIAQVRLTESDNATRVLTEALTPFGLTVRAVASYGDAEWTPNSVDTDWMMVIHFGNVITSDFDVQIAATSEPAPLWIEQARLRPATRLVVSPRVVSKVFLASEVVTPTIAPPPNATATPTNATVTPTSGPKATPAPTPTDSSHADDIVPDTPSSDSSGEADTPTDPLTDAPTDAPTQDPSGKTPTPTVPTPRPDSSNGTDAPTPPPPAEDSSSDADAPTAPPVPPASNTSDANATSTTPPTSAPTPQLLEFSAACVECDTVHLAACSRSQYCRTTVATCLSQLLNQYAFNDLAQTAPDGTVSVDLASKVRSCATGGSYFDWWEPIQRWLGCYAAAQCPITRREQDRSADAFLEFVPATIEIDTIVDDLWSGATPSDFEIAIDTSGTSMTLRYAPVTSIETLQDTLEHASQGISRATVTTASRSDAQGDLITVRYDEPFLGALHVLTRNSNGMPDVVSSVASTEARLWVRSTSNTVPPSWGGLADTLALIVSAAPSGTPQDCSACDSVYLQQCHDLPACRGYFLECLGASIEVMYINLAETDRSVHKVLLGCSRTMPVADWAPVQKYLVCMRDLQCPVSAAGGGDAPTYTRLRAGQLRVSLTASTTQPSISVFFDGTTVTAANASDLQHALQSLVGTTGGVVEMQTREETIDFFFRDYVGKLPTVTYGSMDILTWSPDVVFYSVGAVGTSRVTSELTSREVVPQCSTICYDHLRTCVRGDSYDSLLCRYQTLPCVAQLITTQVYTGVAGVRSSDSTSVDFSDELRSCFASYYPPMRAITQYFTCLAQSECTLNVPLSTRARSELSVRPGEQVLSVAGSHMVGMTPPSGVGDYVLQTFSSLSIDYFAWRLQTTVLNSLATVAVDEEVLADTSQRLTISYTDYLGRLPIESGADVTMVRQAEPSIGISSSDRIDDSQWTRLEDAFNTFTADKSSACTGCAMDHLLNCPVCLSTIVPSLLLMLSDATAFTSPTFNLTDAFYTCVDTLPVGDWLPVARMLSCLMTKGCPLSDDSGAVRPPYPSATFAIVTPATMTLTVPATMQQTVVFATGRAPNHSVTATTDSDTTVPLIIDKIANYTMFKLGLLSVLEATGQSPAITVTEQALDPSTSQQLVLEIEIRDYFGWLPRVPSTTSVPSLETNLPQIVGQTFGNVPGASVSSLVATLQSYAPPTPIPAKVPTAACAQCAKNFYGCELDTIASGQCNYVTATSPFAACLRRQLPPSVFYGVGRVLSTTYVIDAALSKCFAPLMEQDEASGASSFQSDLWNAANDQLACFELNSCAFGPLTEGLASGYMVRLQSVASVRYFDVAAPTFSGVFRSRFGFRVTESTPFSEETSDADLVTLLRAILPQADVAVAKMPPTANGFTFIVTYQQIYYPGFTLTLDAGVAAVTSPPSPPTRTALRTVTLDTTYLDNPAPP